MTSFAEFIAGVINAGNYILSDMEDRIRRMYILGQITEQDMTALLSMAAEKAKDAVQVDVVAKLKELEDRIHALEHPAAPEYVIWTTGYTTAKGETVRFDYNKDGVLDLLRYDGGRASTSLSPGKIDGWHVVDAAGNILGTYHNGEFTPVDGGD